MFIESKGKSLDLSKPRIMGILNVTPDSFSDGGKFFKKDVAIDHVAQMIKDGADIIDIGAESTRPGAFAVSDTEQLERIAPIVEEVAKRFDIMISIDTSSVKVIEETILLGAHIWNDIRALSEDGAIECAAKLNIPVCLMHMLGTPRSMQENPHYENVIAEVKDFLLDRVTACVAKGVRKDNIILDVGFGFGKTQEDNFKLLDNLDEFVSLGFPLLSALSRKSMIGYATGVQNAEDRVVGSVAGALISVIKGAQMVRVHDVRQTREALDVYMHTKGII